MRIEGYLEFGIESELDLLFPIIKFENTPVLFVAEDQQMRLYLCLCSETRGMRRWIVSRTNIDAIKRLLDFETTINDAMKSLSPLMYVIEFRKGVGFTLQEILYDCIDPNFLAEEGVYADFVEEDAYCGLKLLVKRAIFASSKPDNYQNACLKVKPHKLNVCRAFEVVEARGVEPQNIKSIKNTREKSKFLEQTY